MEFSLEDYLIAFEQIVAGVPTTLLLTVAGLMVSFSVAFSCTLLKVVGNKALQRIIDLYILIFSGTPLLFQYFIFYYSPTQFESLNGTWLLDLFSNTWFVAILVIGLNSGAYSSIIFHGAIKNIDAGQWQCCASMGLSRYQTFKLLFPYALRRVLPTYSNEVILLFKGTSLVSILTVSDVLDRARQYYGETYDAITPFLTAGVVYLLISMFLTVVLRFVEKRWMVYAI